MIPKIIHQMGPDNQDSWPYSWVMGHQMTKDVYKDFEIKLWKNSDLYPYVDSNFPQYSNLVRELPGITKFDFFRNILMYLYGGIYYDLDFLMYENMYDKLLHDKPTIIEGMFKHQRQDEQVQNNFLASPKKNKVWLDVMKECKENFYKMDKEQDVYLQVMKISSSTFFTNFLRKYPNTFNILPRDPFNLTREESIKKNFNIPCLHLGTGCWMK